MKRFFALPLLLVAILTASGCANSATPKATQTNTNTTTTTATPAPHDDTGLPAHDDTSAASDDHHAGETNVAPHDDTAPTADHDDSKEPPHRH